MVAEALFPEAHGRVSYGLAGHGDGDARWAPLLNARPLFERESPWLPRAALALDASKCEDGWFVTEAEEEGSKAAQPTTLKVKLGVCV
jgi:hypothetical protein